MRQIRNRQQQRVALLVDLGELGFKRLDLRSARFIRGENRARVLTRLLRARDRLPAAFCSRLRFSTSGISRRRSASSA